MATFGSDRTWEEVFDEDAYLARKRRERAAAMDKPPSQMTDDERRKFNAPDDLGGYRKGGPVKKTGPAQVHKGETVVKKSSATKYGPAKMAAVNKGTAKVTAPAMKARGKR